MKKTTLKVKGMHCTSCEERISESLNKLESVSAKADFVKEIVKVSFDENKVSIKTIEKEIQKMGYKVELENQMNSKIEKSKFKFSDVLMYIIIALGLNMVLTHTFGINIIASIFSFISDLVSNVPVPTDDTSLALLFVIGVLTSFHCVAMCGGINVSQCMSFKSDSKFSPNLMYNLGRVTSYTVLGGIVGLIGSVFTVSISTQAVLYVIVGVFMVLMGLNLYGFNFARKFLPKMPKKFRNINKNGKAPFIVGVLNGLMPCGPLQSMQLYALSTGSFYEGALSMFLFSIGTVPLMYLFGKIGEFKNQNLANKFMKISAVLVLVLGLIMANRGLSLLGFGGFGGGNGFASFCSPSSSSTGITNSSDVSSSNEISGSIEGTEQIIYTDLSPRGYPDLIVKKGQNVVWTINATNQSLTGCNNEIIINEYGIDKKLQIGDNVIEFTPTEVGTYKYSCWMGMKRATITVIE